MEKLSLDFTLDNLNAGSIVMLLGDTNEYTVVAKNNGFTLINTLTNVQPFGIFASLENLAKTFYFTSIKNNCENNCEGATNMKTYAIYEMTVAELKSLAKEKGLKGYSKLKKAELVEMLENALQSSEIKLVEVAEMEDVTTIHEEENAENLILANVVESLKITNCIKLFKSESNFYNLFYNVTYADFKNIVLSALQRKIEGSKGHKRSAWQKVYNLIKLQKCEEVAV